MKFITTFRNRFGVEPICQALEVALSTYYAAVNRPPSARRLEDERLKPQLQRVHAQNLDDGRLLEALADGQTAWHRKGRTMWS